MLTRLADTPFEVFQLRESGARFIVRLGVKSSFTHHENTLRAQGQFNVYSKIAEEIDDHVSTELLPEGLQELPYLRLRYPAGVQQLQQFSVGVESDLQPVS